MGKKKNNPLCKLIASEQQFAFTEQYIIDFVQIVISDLSFYSIHIYTKMGKSGNLSQEIPISVPLFSRELHAGLSIKAPLGLDP